ncbi:unnamed protein product, partial [marine sediment metagenome]
DCTVLIINGINRHSKIIELTDNSDSFVCIIYNVFEEQDYGTIEFFMRTNAISKGINVNLKNNISNNMLFRLQLGESKFRYWDGGWDNVGFPDPIIPIVNTWYHVSINFECTTGTYQDLPQYKWNVKINGKQYGNYDYGNNEKPSQIELTSGSSNTGYLGHFDAIGYLWDNYYNVNDNIFPIFNITDIIQNNTIKKEQ